MSDPRFFMYEREKWINQKRASIEGVYSLEVKEYLVEQEFEDAAFTLKLTIEYSTNIEDKRAKRRFVKWINTGREEYLKLADVIKIIGKNDYNLYCFMINAILLFQNEEGKSVYPELEKVNLYSEQLNLYLKEYKKMLIEAYTEREVVPEYIKELIETGMLLPDGITIKKNLQDVLSYLDSKGHESTIKSVKAMFRNPDGKPYAEGTIKNALDIARKR